MFRKLFGESEQEQYAYLSKKMKFTGIFVIIALLGLLLALIGGLVGSYTLQSMAGLGSMAAVIVCFAWGIAGIKRFFGVASFFSIWGCFRNPVLGAILIVLFVCTAYLWGFFVMLFGIIRYLQLKGKMKNAGM